MDHEFDDVAGRYRLCQTGFALSGLSLGLLSLDAACFLAIVFTQQFKLLEIMQTPAWSWLVGAPITWGSLIGSYLLWGRWRDASWQRRVGPLVLMNGIDVLLWGFDHVGELGLKVEDNHVWLRHILGSGMGWAELMLYASLAADLSGQLGKRDAKDAGRASRTLGTVGLLLWALVVITQTDWGRWPLVRFQTKEGLLMLIGSRLLLAITAFQVTVLCMAAARQCKHYVRELEFDDGHDMLKSRSEDADWGQDRERW